VFTHLVSKKPSSGGQRKKVERAQPQRRACVLLTRMSSFGSRDCISEQHFQPRCAAAPHPVFGGGCNVGHGTKIGMQVPSGDRLGGALLARPSSREPKITPWRRSAGVAFADHIADGRREAAVISAGLGLGDGKKKVPWVFMEGFSMLSKGMGYAQAPHPGCVGGGSWRVG